MEVKEIAYYKWDNKLQFSNDQFETLLTDAQFNPTMAKETPFPSDYLLAVFSNLAYNDNPSKLPNNWLLLTTAYNKNKTNGYFGAAFWNPMLCQVVVAHRGTKLHSMGALFSDVKLAFNSTKTNQSESAATFVYLVSLQICKFLSDTAIRIQLSITGHSLGAWLAQMSSFTLKYFKRHGDEFVGNENFTSSIHPHTVVFESPGCRENLQFLRKRFVPTYVHTNFGNFFTLDMTVYLSAINPINSINKHVGVVYMTLAKSHSLQSILDQFDSNTEYIAKERVLHFESGVKGAIKSIFKTIVQNPNRSVRKIEFKENECSLNVFSETELEFVKYWNYLSKYDSDNIQKIKRRMPLFEVNYESHLMRSTSLNKSIATIKNLNPSAAIIYDLLESIKGINLTEEILAINKIRFQKVKFRKGYFFKDRYGIKKFLNSSNKVLHIHVNSSAQYELETYVLYNVMKYYESINFIEPHLHTFINLNLLPTIFRRNMFNNSDFKLLLIECDILAEDSFVNIKKLLSEVPYKIILISTFPFYTIIDNNLIVSVNGFSHCIKYQDLQEICQENLSTEKIVVFNKKELSMNDLVGQNFSVQEKPSNYWNEMLSTNLLIRLLDEATFEHLVVLESSCSNILTDFTIELCQEIDLKNTLLKRNKNVEFLIQNSKELGISLAKELNVLFKTCSNIEQECLSNLDKIFYIFTHQSGKLFLESICRFDLYIKRKIVHRRCLNLKKLNKFREISDAFFFYGNQKEIKNISRSSNFDFYENEVEAIKGMEKANTNAHVLKITDKGTLQWIRSKGKIEYLQTYWLPTTVETSELMKEKCVIISGDPGQGKSTMVKKIFLMYQQIYWTFVIPLQYANFECFNYDINMYSAVKFILSTSDATEDDVSNILLFCLSYKVKLTVYLLFDGYDQIKNSDFRIKFIKLINFLKQFANAKILITTQPYLTSELENGISVPASHFDSTNLETESINYLSKFWESFSQIFDLTDIEKLKSSAELMLSSAKNIFGENISTFLTIPLHIRTLAEIMQPTSINPTQISTLSDLRVPYDKLIEVRCDIYFKRNRFPNNVTLKKFTLNGIFEKLYNLAIKQITNDDLNFLESHYLEELNKVGLIQADSKNNISFLHDSLRDYFFARFAYLWLENRVNNRKWDVNYFISDIFFKPQHKEIRTFINCHLENCKISPATLNTCTVSLKVVIEENKHFSDTGDTFFHTAVEESLNFVVEHLLMQITSESNFEKLLVKRNADLKTALFLTIERINENHVESNILKMFLHKISFLPLESTKLILLSTLMMYHTTEEHIEVLSHYSSLYNIITEILHKIKISLRQKDSLLEACKSNNFEDFKKIIKEERDLLTKKHLLQITNSFKENGLHLTSHRKIIHELLECGVDINVQDHHGMTPIARAIKDGKEMEVFNLLVKRGADITITDNFQNSPFLHAIKLGNCEILSYFMKSGKVDVNKTNVFSLTYLMAACRTENDGVVRWLLDKGADINAVDSNNLSALFHCVKSNRTKLTKFLIKKGAHINVQDCYGTTPLLYSIKKSNWNMANALIDKGANVSISNKFGEHPVKILIEKQKPRIIERISNQNSLNFNDIENILDRAEMEYLQKFKHVFNTNID